MASHRGVWTWLVAIVAMHAGTAHADQLIPVATDPPPLTITGGTLAEPCTHPATVSLRDFGNIRCSGSLVHPRVVLTAAHCVDAFIPTDIGFGADGFRPDRTVGVQGCERHPNYMSAETLEPNGTEAFDVGVCVLTEAVDDVPIVPPLMGCEADVLEPDLTMTIVGYGSTAADLDLEFGWIFTEGIGPKRTATQTLESTQDDALWLLGNGIGACPGDSGGPALVQLADGTWRVVGAGSRIHPDSPLRTGNDCGYGAIYSYYAHVMPWIEDTAGFDITPCHDGDGTWNPDERCTEFPLAPGDAAQSSGTWRDGCATTALSEPGATCGPAFDPGAAGSDSGDSSDSGSGSGGSSSGGSTTGDPGTTSGALDDSTTAAVAASDDDPGPGAIDPGSSSEGSDATSIAADGNSDDGGCGCRSTPSPGWAWVIGVAPLCGRLRRRRRF